MKYYLVIMCSMLMACSAHASGFAKHDAHLPVDISAASLEVLQQDKKAIFSGDVVATQGKIILKADTMTVFYNDSKDSKNASSVSKIEVEGSVHLSTPEESARGRKGIYDVDGKEIRLLGDITLTREKNVLKGESLVYNFITGKSSVKGADTKAPHDSTTGRVRGLFIPNESKP